MNIYIWEDYGVVVVAWCEQRARELAGELPWVEIGAGEEPDAHYELADSAAVERVFNVTDDAGRR